jgi:hypothetical protein
MAQVKISLSLRTDYFRRRCRRCRTSPDCGSISSSPSRLLSRIHRLPLLTRRHILSLLICILVFSLQSLLPTTSVLAPGILFDRCGTRGRSTQNVQYFDKKLVHLVALLGPGQRATSILTRTVKRVNVPLWTVNSPIEGVRQLPTASHVREVLRLVVFGPCLKHWPTCLRASLSLISMRPCLCMMGLFLFSWHLSTRQAL